MDKSQQQQGCVLKNNNCSANDYTSIRGKTILISPTEEQFELLKKRLQERIDDNRGETIYDIGIGEGSTFYIIFITPLLHLRYHLHTPQMVVTTVWTSTSMPPHLPPFNRWPPHWTPSALSCVNANPKRA